MHLALHDHNLTFGFLTCAKNNRDSWQSTCNNMFYWLVRPWLANGTLSARRHVTLTVRVTWRRALSVKL